MRLSTSSSKWLIAVPAFIACFFAGDYAVKMLNSREKSNLSYDERSDAFFCRKLDETRFPIVIYGDSRTYRGVSSSVISNSFAVATMNFGFSSGGINGEMLSFLFKRIDMQSSRKMVILGISPFSLSSKARANEQYHEMQRKHALLDSVSVGGGLLKSYSLQRLMKRFGGDTSSRRSPIDEKFRADGWCPTVPTRFANVQVMFERGIEVYRSEFSSTACSELSICELCAWIGRCRSSSVKVVLFRIPSSTEMVAIEDKMSGFDESAFVKRVVSAGAIWIPMEQGAYESYDASHLTASAAEKMTERLCDRIKKRIGERAE